MSIKKFAVLSLSVLGLMGTESNATSVSFTGGAELALFMSQCKNETHLTNSAITSLMAQRVNMNGVMRYFARVADEELANFCKSGAVGKAAPNLIKIIITRYDTDTSANPKSEVQQWQYEASNSYWNNSGKMVFGGQVFAFAGVKAGNATFKLGPVFEIPFANKKIKTSLAAPSSKDSNNKSDSKSSNTAVNTDIEETKKFGYGVGGEVSFDVNDCVSLGAEFGMKKLNSKFNVKNVNTNFLGLPTGVVPTYAKDTVVKENATSEDVTKYQRSTTEYPVINELNASMWAQYFGLKVGFNINKHLSVSLAGGMQSGGDFKLKNDKKDIKYPDFRTTQKTGFYMKASIGFNF